MRPADVSRKPDGRPDFMVLLGLAPPYSVADVKQAYLAKAKVMHPDTGGDAHQFRQLHEAYLQAQKFLSIKGDSLRWIGNHIQEYLESRELATLLRGYGAQVETAGIDWLRRSFGDFAELTEAILSVRIANADLATTNAVLTAMTAATSTLQRLARLELTNCNVGDLLIDKIMVFKGLQHLDLTGNPISSNAAQALLNRLPSLTVLEVTDTSVGWWTKRRIDSTLKKRKA